MSLTEETHRKQKICVHVLQPVMRSSQARPMAKQHTKRAYKDHNCMSARASQVPHHVLGLLDSVTDVVAGCELFELLLGMSWQALDAIYKLHHGLLCDLLPARECLELLVRVGHSIPVGMVTYIAFVA